MSAVHKKLAAARKVIKPVLRTETADTGKYTYEYSTIGSVMQAVDAACAEARLQWWQTVMPLHDLNWQMITWLYDFEGDDEPEPFPGAINTTKADPQANGSALTYARRYSLVVLFSLNQIDDDAALAHRAVINPTNRTPAETEIREIVRAMPDAMTREDFQAAFVEVFGSTLTALPESKHGDALTFTKAWTPKGGTLTTTPGATS